MLATQLPAAAPSRLLGTSTAELKFRIQGGEHHGRILRIAGAKCSIGSAPGCTLRLRGDGIEPLHCLIVSGRNGTVVRRNSPRTYLNGGAFHDAPLNPGDLLRIGPVELVVVSCPAGSGSQPISSRPVQPEIDTREAASMKQELAKLQAELLARAQELQAARAELEQARQNETNTAAEKTPTADQLRNEYSQELERFQALQRQERAESLAREQQLEGELARWQENAERNQQELETRLADREASLQQELEESRQRAEARAAEQVRTLENLLRETRELAESQRRELLEEQQAQVEREQAEFASVRSGLETTISTLKKQLTRQQAELAARERGGEQPGTLTVALDDVRFEIRETQSLHGQEAGDRNAVRGQLEAQVADLTARLVEREKELAQREEELTELRQRAAHYSAADQMVKQLEESLAATATAQQSEREAWQQLRSELEARQNGLEAAKADLQTQREAANAECDRLRTLLSETESAASFTRERIVELTASLDRAASEQSAGRAELEQLSQKYGIQSEQLAGVQSQCEALQSECGQLRAQCEALSAERSELTPKAAQFEAAANRCEALELQIAELNKSLHLATTEAARHAALEQAAQEQTAQQIAQGEQLAGLQSQCAALQSDCDQLRAQCEALNAERSELAAKAAHFEAGAARCETLEQQIAELNKCQEQAPQEQAAQQQEEQIERWQSEAHKYQLQAEELGGQLAAARQLGERFQAELGELQSASREAGGAVQQDLQSLQAQLDTQRQQLIRTATQLQQDREELERLRTEDASRREGLIHAESEQREQQAAWEMTRKEQAAQLEERSQLIASQIAQFEAEQAAFAKQQASLIHQMTSLEDRVQELTISQSRASNSPFVIPQLDDPSLVGGLERDSHPYTRAEAPQNPDAANAESVADPAAPPEEVDNVVNRLMQAGLWKGNDSEASESQSPAPPAPEKTPYTPPSFLDRAAELVREEEMSQPPAAAPAPEPVAPARPSAGAAHASEEDSIEQYMARLLNRVRGGDAPATTATFVREEAPPVDAAPPPPVEVPMPVSEVPQEPLEFLPRAQAPEQAERLSLMRELANSAAKSAITTHARQHHKRQTKRRSMAALLSLLGAAGLFVVGCVTGSMLAFAGSGCFVVVCGIMSIRAAWAGVRQLRLAPPSEIGDLPETAAVAEKDESQPA